MRDLDKTIFSECFNIFMHFGKSRNLSQTATAFGVSLSSASRRIRRLEGILETDLIVPGKRPFTLTSAGLRLYGAMSLECNRVEEIIESVRGSGRVARKLRIGFLASFTQASASIINNCSGGLDSVLNITGTTDRLTALFNSGEIDAVVTSEIPCDLAKIRSFCFLREPTVVVIPQRAVHNLPEAPSWRNLAFCGFPFISAYRLDRSGKALTNFLSSNGIQLLSRLEVDNVATRLNLIADGLGWSLIPVTSLYENRLLVDELLDKQIAILPSPRPAAMRRIMFAVGSAVNQTLFEKLSEEIHDFTGHTIIPWAEKKFHWLKGSMTLYRPGESTY